MTKKTTLLLTSLAIVAFASQAGPISPEQAESIASQFATSSTSPFKIKSTATGAATAKVAYAATSTTDASRNLLYVVNNGNGYVVVAGDDAAPDMVLGYADGGQFSYDQAPENLRHWLDEYARQIEYMTANGITAADQAQAPKFDTEVAPMLTTQWDQNAPYNALCPNGYPTGCVATAMAQVMNYHEWPKQGTGSHSYNWNGQTLSADFGSTTYDWNNMADIYDGTNSDAENDAVATLMYHCGVATEMVYSGSASGTYSYKACEALVEYFGYPKNIQTFNRDFRTYDEWISLIKGEIDAGRPVIMGGSSSSGGHEFVIDGYNTDGYFHLNWGWSGQSDGYYLIATLNPYEGLGTGGGSGRGYKYQQEIIANVQPPVEGENVDEIYEICSDGFSTDASSVALGSSIELTFATLINIGRQAVSINIGVQIVDEENGNEVASAYESKTNEADVSYYFFSDPYHINMELSESLPDGRYRIYPAYMHSADNKLKGRIHVSQAASQYISMTVEGGTATFSHPATPIQCLKVENVTVTANSSFKANVATTVTASITNDGDTTFSDMLSFALLKQNSDDMVFYRNAIDQTTGYTGYYDVYTVASGETQEVEMSLTITGFTATDDYYRVAIVDKDLNIIGTPQLVKASNPRLTIDGEIEILPSPENVDANDITARVTLRNTSSKDEYRAGVSADILNEKGITVHKLDYKSIEIEAGGSLSVTFNGVLPGAEAGESYILRIHNSAINTHIMPYETEFTIGTSYSGINDIAAPATTSVVTAVYPNPVSHVLNINATADIKRVAVYSLAGTQEAYYTGNGSQSMQIDMSHLAAGAYFVRIATENATETVKIIKN